ncbi:MAG: hypothetical protein GEV06_21005 [Luteitalea sp.]|nr:hypothetical protein [Luteitalea sp.]
MKRDPVEEHKHTATVEGVLAQLEGDYFYDYAAFTGSLREYVVRALEARYKSEPNELHKRAFLLNVYREEYTAYEDLGAFMDAFLSIKGDPTILPLHRMISYGAGQVKLGSVLERHQIDTGDDLYNGLGLAEWMPASWSEHHPKIDLQKVLRRACYFLVEDCWPGQRATGVRAFNKIKHGLVLVPDGRPYASKLPSAPAIIFATHPKDPASKETPVSILAIPTEPEKVEERLRIVHFTQFMLRMFAMLYVLKRYPAAIGGRGLKADASVFGSERMVDVLEFMRNSSETPWSK